jgi:hypothetical protein
MAMRVVLIILGLLAVLIAGSQTLRHIYVRWVEPRGSLLDQFQGQAAQDIAASKPLGELVAQYGEAKKRVDEEDAKLNEVQRETEYRRMQQEPYKSERQLNEAITQREEHHRQLRELHFYWWCGIAIAAIGFVAFFKLNRWFSVSLMILGYIEMIYGTCPSFRSFGAAQEFDTLLTAKTIYSLLTVAVVLVYWRWIAGSAAATSAP